jgi:hypothetical protein
MIAILFKGIEKGIFRKFMCIGVMIAMFFVLCGIVSATPCFPDTCIPNNDGCIGPSYPCTADANCSDDGWYCCGPKATGNPLEETFYRDYFCNASNMCDYTITNAVDCDADDKKYCEGDIRKNKDCNCAEGDINVACYCIITSKDCNDDNGCYAYGTGCEDRDYYCSGGSCRYTVSNRHTDYYDDWVYYCDGDNVRKHRKFHNFYCDGGSCSDHESNWTDDQLVEPCDDKDGWYLDGPSADEYRDYYCSNGDCDNYTVTGHRCNAGFGNCDGDWSNGCEVNLNTDPNNCGSCGNSCGANAYCTGGTCHCNAGFGNCDGDWSNGCEVNLNTDPNNCGACGNVCPPELPICEEGECVPEASTLVLFATGLLSLAGYVGLKRRKTK